MSVRLFIGNLPYDATEAELKTHFSVVGPLSYIYLPIDAERGKPRGFAFIEFQDSTLADDAILRFNNQPFKGRPISVKEARSRDEAERSGGSVRSVRPGGAPPSRAGSAPSSRPGAPPPSRTSEPPGRDGPPRSFLPETPVRRPRTKAKGGSRTERPPKQPLREVVRGQFFGGFDDEPSEDDLPEDNFASRAEDSAAEPAEDSLPEPAKESQPEEDA
jgi:RNA recognition motif-containing protein